MMETKVEIGDSKLVFTELTSTDAPGAFLGCASSPLWIDDAQRMNGPTSAYFGARIVDVHPYDWISFVCYDQAELNSHPAWRVIAIASQEKDHKKTICSELLFWSQQEILRKSGMATFWGRVRVHAVPFFQQNRWACVTGQYKMSEQMTPGPFVVMTKNLFVP